jgi:hypothetical protein
METLFHWLPVPQLARVVGIVSVLSDNILTTHMFSPTT